MRAIASPTSSAGETSLERTSSACAVASIHAVSSLMGGHGSRRARGARRRRRLARIRRVREAVAPGRPACARPDGDRLGHRHVGAAGHAASAVVELAPAVAVLEDHRPLTLERVAVPPLQQGDQHGPQVGALLGQAVLAAQRALLVRTLHEDSLLDQALQPGLQDVARHAQVALEVLEATDAQEDVADDQERPPLTRPPRASRRRGSTGWGSPASTSPQHSQQFRPVRCFMQLSSYSAFHDTTH